MSKLNLFCSVGTDMGLSDAECAEIAEDYRCAPDEDDLKCEHCGKLVRVIYKPAGRSQELICIDCFYALNGPEIVRELSAREQYEDNVLEDYMEDHRNG